MRKYNIISLLALGIAVASCGGQTEQKKNTPTAQKNHKIVKEYTCVMDTDVIKDKPGICPKCGMQLVEKNK